jgi:predicted TPR repeat methyltransferase
MIYGNLAAICGMQGRFPELIDLLKTTLQLNPNCPEAHSNLGNALKEQGDLSAAIAAYNTALQLSPNHPNTHNNLGNALKDQGDLTAAIASYNTALKLNPNHPEFHYNLGNALKEQGDIRAAIAAYNTALQLNPNHPDAYNNLSTAELQIGDFKSGWERYEYRFQAKSNKGILNAKPNCPRWDGKPLSPQDQLLLISEQGLGDTLQFMRYAIALRDKGIAVSLCAQPKLHTLIQASGLDPSPLTPEQANQVTDGQWIPLLSLPRHLEVSPDNPIISEPYIKTTDELISKWENIFSKEKRPIIGVNWQGNREDNRKAGRSFPVEHLRDIAKELGALLVYLQRQTNQAGLRPVSANKSFAAAQAEIYRLADSDLPADFAEYSAVVANCDLVISTATTLCHLAAAMGKTTWTLLQKTPEWRWGLEGDSSFWYPSMRLFRQQERGNWNEVLERAAVELKGHFGNASATQPAATTADKKGKIKHAVTPLSPLINP